MRARFPGTWKPVLTLAAVLAVAAAGGTYATGTSAPDAGGVGAAVSVTDAPGGSPSGGAATETEDAEGSGSTVARFHDAAACPLPEGVALEGNWTHGNYVSAWAATGDHDKTHAAAKSDCGKPLSAVDVEAATLDDDEDGKKGRGEEMRAKKADRDDDDDENDEDEDDDDDEDDEEDEDDDDDDEDDEDDDLS